MAGLPHRHLLTLTLEVDMGAVLAIGATPAGHRSIAPVVGGRFEGERLRGVVLPGGADWVVTRADGSMAIDVRLTLRTDDGAHVYLAYQGVLQVAAAALGRFRKGEPLEVGEYSIRTVARFETGQEGYRWLNDMLAVAIGTQTPTGPVYEVFEIG